ncbi:MAG: MBL fold metallo-hydrolase, partial [Lachnospiraceae bacterium]|nr:MBL fold metallo-hydrolase [Lachnospiraceae bacterium]
MKVLKNLQLKTLVLGPVSTNCYLLKNRESGALLIIDPADRPERIRQEITELQGEPEAILLTHGHFDHIGAVSDLKRFYGIPVFALDVEEEVLSDPEKNLTCWNGGGYTLEPDRFLTDQDRLIL